MKIPYSILKIYTEIVNNPNQLFVVKISLYVFALSIMSKIGEFVGRFIYDLL